MPDFLVTPDRRYLSIAVDCDIVAPDDAERVRFLRSAHASFTFCVFCSQSSSFEAHQRYEGALRSLLTTCWQGKYDPLSDTPTS